MSQSTSVAQPEESAASPDRRERQRARKRQELVDATRAVIGRKGLEGATIADITEEADVGFGTFYTYFETKDDAVRSLVDDTLHQLNEQNRQLLERTSDPAELLALALANTITLPDRDPVTAACITRMVFSEDRKMFTELGRSLRFAIDWGAGEGRFADRGKRMVGLILGSSVIGFLRARTSVGQPMGREAEEAFLANLLRVVGVADDDAWRLASDALESVSR